MLKFCKDGRVLFDGEYIELSKINAEEFFVANLSIPIELEDGITMEKIMSSFSYLRTFIYQYFSDHYDRLKPLIEARDMGEKYEKIKIFKKAIVEDGFLHIQPSVDFVLSSGGGEIYNFIGQMPVFISNDIVVIEDGEKKIISGNLKSKITLQDLLEAIFEDLIYSITEGFIE